jgi:hypothetical protein
MCLNSCIQRNDMIRKVFLIRHQDIASYLVKIIYFDTNYLWIKVLRIRSCTHDIILKRQLESRFMRTAGESPGWGFFTQWLPRAKTPVSFHAVLPLSVLGLKENWNVSTNCIKTPNILSSESSFSALNRCSASYILTDRQRDEANRSTLPTFSF